MLIWWCDKWYYQIVNVLNVKSLINYLENQWSNIYHNNYINQIIQLIECQLINWMLNTENLFDCFRILITCQFITQICELWINKNRQSIAKREKVAYQRNLKIARQQQN